MLLTRIWDAVPTLIVVTLNLMTLASDTIQDVTFRLFEHPPAKQIVGNIFQAARLLDHVRSVRLDSVEPKWLPLFYLDRPTGNLYTSDRAPSGLDRETICPVTVRDQITRLIENQCVLNLLASVNNKILIKINIIVEDLNDNSPTFPNISVDSSFHVQIVKVDETNTVNSTKINLKIATDLDGGGLQKIYYYLTPDDTPFYLIHKRRSDSKHGLEELYLVPRQPLDYEQTPEYWVNLTACDGQLPRSKLSPVDKQIIHCSTQLIHILVQNLDDEKPVFEQTNYSVILKETAPVGHELITVKATDADAPPFNQIRYYILPISNSQKDLIQIDPIEGLIRLIKPIPGPGVYRFLVLATSDLTFNNSFANTDYLGPNLNDRNIDTNIARVTLHVIASNNHAPSVTLQNSRDTSNNVLNLNGLISTESAAFIQVSEKTPVPHVLAYFRVVDPDSVGNANTQCTFQSTAQIPPDLSSLLIRQNITQMLDLRRVSQLTEHVSIYRLILTLTIDAEQLVKRPLSLPNSALSHLYSSVRIVGVVPIQIRCQDNGDPALEGSLLIYLVIVDEDEYLPQLQVTLPDGKQLHPAVKQDGHRPVLMYNMSVKEDVSVGTIIFRLSVTDRDVLSRPIYELLDNRSHVQVNQTTGSVMVTQAYDFETDQFHRVDIVVKEFYNWSAGSLPKMNATVIIQVEDVNDNSPVFTYPPLLNQTLFDDLNYWKGYFVDGLRVLKVAEELPEGTRLGQIKAIDLDSGLNAEIRYFIVDSKSNPSKNWTLPFGTSSRSLVTPSLAPKFMINNEGYIWSKSRLDREVIKSIDLLIGAQDLGTPALTSYTTLRLLLTDINDHQPQWQFPTEQDQLIVIPLDTETGSTVTRVRAIDPDDVRHNGRVSYSLLPPNDSLRTDGTDVSVQCGLANLLFRVDENNGEVMLRHSVQTLPSGFLDVWLVVTDHGEEQQRYSFGKLVVYFNQPQEEITIDKLMLLYRDKSQLIVNQLRVRKSLDQILSLLSVRSSSADQGHVWRNGPTHLPMLIGCIVAGLFLLLLVIVAVLFCKSKRRRQLRKTAGHLARHLYTSGLQKSSDPYNSSAHHGEVSPKIPMSNLLRERNRVSLKRENNHNRIEPEIAVPTIQSSLPRLVDETKFDEMPSTSHVNSQVFQCRQEAALLHANNTAVSHSSAHTQQQPSLSTPISVTSVGHADTIISCAPGDSEPHSAYIPVNSFINFPSTIPLKILTLSSTAYPMTACLSESDSDQSYLNFPNIITSIVPVCHVQPDFIPVCSSPSAASSNQCTSYLLDPSPQFTDHAAVIQTCTSFVLPTTTGSTVADVNKLYKDKLDLGTERLVNAHVHSNNHTGVNFVPDNPTASLPVGLIVPSVEESNHKLRTMKRC
ncbi:unnamed protein product [Echinostoma caproni]|uniref:Protocadherin-11 Y-linked n=1 Tax=Echinostoma caproni TaxID=27848 RepID=A0A183A4Y6_9TREM|nr:unnamed protein product [Echinostoma caproni]